MNELVRKSSAQSSEHVARHHLCYNGPSVGVLQQQLPANLGCARFCSRQESSAYLHSSSTCTTAAPKRAVNTTHQHAVA
jgi:hypothetical protein